MKINNVLQINMIAILALTIVLLGNGLIWWGVGALFISAFNIPYVWTFAKGFALGLVLFMASPAKIKISANDFIEKVTKKTEEEDDIE